MIVVHVLTDVPPSVPQRGEPLVSVLTSRKFQPKWERARFRRLKRRYIEQPIRRLDRKIREEKFGGDYEYGDEEFFEEESIA